jgi:hypothetical protein
MTRSERIADQLDRHWHKNLRPRLHGLADEEYFWEPVRGCWSIRPRGTSAAPTAPVTTIAWRLAHIIVSCLGYRVAWHFGGQEVDSQTFAYAGTADEALRQLDEMYGRWNAGVRELSDADLENPPPVGPERFPMEAGRTKPYRDQRIGNRHQASWRSRNEQERRA